MDLSAAEHKPEPSQTGRTIFYKTMSRKITLVILIASFAPMLFTTGILVFRFNRSYNDKIQAHISELVQKHSKAIDSFLFEKLGNIRFLGQQFSDTSQPPDEFLAQNLLVLNQQYGGVFTDLGLIDSQGIQVAYSGPFRLENADYSTAEWFMNAKENPFYISDVFAGLRGHPHFIIAVRVHRNDRNYILRATISFSAFNSLVENIHIGKTGLAFVINRKGLLQTNTFIEVSPDIIRSLLGKYDGNKNNTVFMVARDRSGNDYLYKAAFLKNIDWLIVFRQDSRDALSELKKTQALALAVLVLGGLVIIAIATLLPKKIVAVIIKADAKSEMMNQQVVESGKLATIGELAAGIAHEINNPVAIMVEEAGWIEDLLEEEDLKECENLTEFKRALLQIATQGRRCKEITHKLLSFARKTDSTTNDVEINEAIREIVSFTAQMARYNNVIIETNLGEGLPFIRISPSELQQVILNLINNAIDAMEKSGGTIKIETKISQIEKDHLVVTIEDNGPGIPQINLNRIFDPFFTTKPVGKGTGLGLSICYGIIQKMGGKIDVQSQVGVGSKFRIWIPFQERTARKLPDTVSGQPGDGDCPQEVIEN